MKFEKQITFKVPSATLSKLENLAKDEGLSVSDVIRLALKKALEPHATSFFNYKCDLKNRIYSNQRKSRK